MASTGFRSVEVTVINDASGDLAIQGPTGKDSWIQGEQPKAGDVLNQYQSAQWGVFTNNQSANADANVQFTGLGTAPIGLHFYNLFNSVSACQFTGNESVAAVVTQVSSPDQLHTSFTVQFIPAVGGAKS